MAEFLLHPTTTAQWHALVNEAQDAAHQDLDESLESYLVFLLMRFATQPEVAGRVLALDYLQAMRDSGHQRANQLRDLGDHCLLFSGLFPERADRLRVRISYFVNLGRGAYGELSNTVTQSAAELYEHLAEGFIALMDTLHAMRELGSAQARLSPLHAYELWHDTGSRHARETLYSYTRGVPLYLDDDTPSTRN